jgi:hypothetical protein
MADVCVWEPKNLEEKPLDPKVKMTDKSMARNTSAEKRLQKSNLEITVICYLNKLDSDGRFSNTSPAHNDDFVRLCNTTAITRLRHDDRRPAKGVYKLLGISTQLWFNHNVKLYFSTRNNRPKNKNNQLMRLGIKGGRDHTR